MSDDEVAGAEVDYSIRAPGDFVVSGPLETDDVVPRGPGRLFKGVRDALQHVEEDLGHRVIRRINEAEEYGRWAFLVRPEA